MNIFKNISNLFKIKFYFVNELERFPKPAEAEKTKEKKTDAQIKKEAIEAGIKYHSSYENNLQRWLDKLSQTEKANDPEFNTFKNKVAEKISRRISCSKHYKRKFKFSEKICWRKWKKVWNWSWRRMKCFRTKYFFSGGNKQFR